jgi:hypothetical protein
MTPVKFMNLNESAEKKLRNMMRIISLTLGQWKLLVDLFDEELHVHSAELVDAELYVADAFASLDVTLYTVDSPP